MNLYTKTKTDSYTNKFCLPKGKGGEEEQFRSMQLTFKLYKIGKQQNSLHKWEYT